MKLETATRLHDALMACEEILGITEMYTEDEFLADRIGKLAIWKLLEIVGEALRRAEQSDPTLGSQIAQLRLIIDTRNRITHGYDSVNFQMIWGISQVEIAPLRSDLQRLLRDAPDISR